MSEPAKIAQTLEERARLARQQQRETLMRQLKSALKADDLDIGRTYTEILEEIHLLVTIELQSREETPDGTVRSDAGSPDRPDAGSAGP